MRSSTKNQTLIWYALRNVSLEADEWGNTRDVTTYSSPQKIKISISANKGEVGAQTFGADLKYDREMVTHDMSCPIDEYTRLWIGEPVANRDITTVWTEGDTIYINEKGSVVEADKGGFVISGTTAHNYEVAAVSRSLNCIRYAIRRVNVSQ